MSIAEIMIFFIFCNSIAEATQLQLKGAMNLLNGTNWNMKPSTKKSLKFQIYTEIPAKRASLKIN